MAFALTLLCDGCSESWTYPLPVGGLRADIEGAREEARRTGWRRLKVDGAMRDYCPACVAEIERSRGAR